MLTLWTIQKIEAYELLKTRGWLAGDSKFAIEDFLEPYAWMTEQLAGWVGPPPVPGILPIWAWYQYDNAAHRRPDLRRSAHCEKGTPAVRIEFQIDPKHVLLSDFVLWHHVLNRFYLAGSLDEDDAFDREVEEHGLGRETNLLQHPEYGPRIKASWQRIFDLDWDDPDMTPPRPEKSIQAVFWKLRLDMVRRVDFFTSR